MDRLQGHDRAAVDPYAHALVLVDRLQQHINRRNRLPDIEKVARGLLAEAPGDQDALALEKLCQLGRAEQGADLARVARDFGALVVSAPQNVLLHLGLARALERLGAAADRPDPQIEPLRQALGAYEAAWKIAPQSATWEKVEACKGRARVLLQLQQPQQAEQAWQEARRLDPALPSWMAFLQGSRD
jgi:tetratricopeptide (TPR) repeat protein